MNCRKAAGVLSLVVLMGLATIGRASAASIPLALDNSWVVLDDEMSLGRNPWFTGAGTPSYSGWTGVGAASPVDATTWEWNSPGSVLFRITDYWIATDGYEVYDQGSLVGTVNNGQQWNAIPGCTNPFFTSCGYTDLADAKLMASPFMSHQTFLFAPGFHAISIKAIGIPLESSLQNPFPDSTVAFSASTPVPEPTSMLLLGTGLVGVASRMRARRRQQSQR